MVLYTRKHRIPFQIDEEDFELVSRYTWCGAKDCDNPYPVTTVEGHYTLLHVLLMGPAPRGFYWDHRNRDPRDNHRSNLRLVTPSISLRNTGLRSDNTSGVRGVYWAKGDRCWVAFIGDKRRNQPGRLGSFHSFEDAVAARLVAE